MDGDDAAAQHDRRIALCLSGGGYRATLFHLGAVTRLNELGLLARLDTLSSVSGGSILSAFLADRMQPWPAPGTVVPPDEFRARIATPIEAFCATNVRTGPIVKRLVPWNWLRSDTAVRELAKIYESHVTKKRLGELGGHPRFVFCATDMVFGVNWMFDSADPKVTTRARAREGDYQVGYRDGSEVPVALAVAASSCFPPVFNPLRRPVEPNEFSGGKYREDDRDALARAMSLTDGGVYDNLGLQPVVKRYGTLLVSDGGAVFEPLGDLGRFATFKRIYRYSAIAGRGGGALRRESVVGMFASHRRQGTYWGIGTPPSRYDDRSEYAYPDDLVRTRIEPVRTDLDRFSAAEQAVLQNHGYLQTDAAARSYLAASTDLVDDPLPPTKPPYPEWLDATRVRTELARSSKRVLPFGRR
jgi:NTE family protein